MMPREIRATAHICLQHLLIIQWFLLFTIEHYTLVKGGFSNQKQIT